MARCAGPKAFNVPKHLQDRLIESEIPRRPRNFALLDQEQTVASHAGHDLFVGVDFADVPEPRDQQTSVGGGDHLLERRITAGDNQIHRSFPVFIGQGESRGRWALVPACLAERREYTRFFTMPLIDERDALAWHAFAVEGSAKLVADGRHRR